MKMEPVRNLDDKIFNIIEEIQDIIDAIYSNEDKDRRRSKVLIYCRN